MGKLFIDSSNSHSNSNSTILETTPPISTSPFKQQEQHLLKEDNISSNVEVGVVELESCWENVSGLEEQVRRFLSRLSTRGVQWKNIIVGGSAGFEESVVFLLRHGGDVETDGNCLFTAMSKALAGDRGVVIDAKELRRRTVSRFLKDFGMSGGGVNVEDDGLIFEVNHFGELSSISGGGGGVGVGVGGDDDGWEDIDIVFDVDDLPELPIISGPGGVGVGVGGNAEGCFGVDRHTDTTELSIRELSGGGDSEVLEENIDLSLGVDHFLVGEREREISEYLEEKEGKMGENLVDKEGEGLRVREEKVVKESERVKVDKIVKNMYSPELKSGWGIHVVQEVKLLAKKKEREIMEREIDELIQFGMQREMAAEEIYKQRCIEVKDGASWAKYMAISGSPDDEFDIITLQYTEEGLLSVDENILGRAAAFGDDIAIVCLATVFHREIYVVQAHGSDAMVDEDNCVFFLPHQPRSKIHETPLFLFMKGTGWCGAGADHYEPLIAHPAPRLSIEKAAVIL